MPNLDYMVVVDVEASCWAGKPPEGEQNEIIEVGVCLFDLTTFERSAKQSILVKPSRSKISSFCTELTTLTQALVDTGVSFDEACQQLQADYGTAGRWWGSWGAYDRKMFQLQCVSYGVDYPFSNQHLNIKETFARLNGLRPMGMKGALAHLNLPLEGTHHRGGDDAWNIALILSHMMRQYSVEKVLAPFT